MNMRYLVAVWALAAAQAAASQVDLANVAQLSARGNHACVVTTSGGAKCWGSNSNGQLGGGAVGDYRSSATDVTGLTSGVVAVAAALGSHTCAIVSGGAVKCWGANGNGQLGDGTTTDRAAPVDVQGLPAAAVALAGGGSHTCAVLATGAVACWGANSFGQLGDGTTTSRATPVLVTGLSAVAALSGALNHTCALSGAGGVKCWGSNDQGQLGTGTRTSSAVPVDVSGLSAGVAGIDTAGEPGGTPFAIPDSFSCAVMSAGTIKCWGGGTLLPQDRAGVANIASLAMNEWRYFAGVLNTSYPELNSCGITTAGGVQCWGSSRCFGLLGDGGAATCTQSDIMAGGPVTDVMGISSTAVSVAIAGTSFACALMADGRVLCWGGNYGGTASPAKEGTSTQSVRFNPPVPSGMAVGASATVSATACCSSNPITFSSLTPAVCSVSGTTVTALAGGTCTLAADQAASAYFDAAPQAAMSFAINPRLAQAITLGPLPTLVVNGVGYVVATSSSGLPVSVALQFAGNCSISGTLLRGLEVGTCYLQITQAGDSTYAPASPLFVQLPVAANAGTWPLVVYNFGGGSGKVTSVPAGVDCGATCAGNFALGSTVTLTASAAAGSRFAGWTGACSGAASCVVTMDAAKTVNALFDADIPRLTALSTRGWVDMSNNTMIGGFIIGGASPKTVVVRARGPSLAASGVANVVSDPMLQVVRASDGAAIATNGEMSSASNASTIVDMGFGVPNRVEAAVMLTLQPGAYTVLVTAQTTISYGVGLFEVYEIDGAEQQLLGISTRGQVLSGDNALIGGFIVQGNAPQKVVVRARGPSLAALGVPGVLADPMLQLVRASDGVVFTNDDWQQDANASALAASGYAPSDDKEAAILITLPPGAYTAIVRGARLSTGTGIVEVYRVP